MASTIERIPSGRPGHDSYLCPSPSAKESSHSRENVHYRKPKTIPRTSPSCTQVSVPDESKLGSIYDLALSHIEAFNFAVGDGLQYAVNDIPSKSIRFSDGRGLDFWLENVHVSVPTRSDPKNTSSIKHSNLQYPVHCREAHSHYGGKLTAVFCFQTTSGTVFRVDRSLGIVPVMVRSKLCNLANAKPKQMIRHHEDATEFGGYFICNGNERVVRHLQIPHRNHIMAVSFSSFEKYGQLFSNKAVSMRSVGPDQTGRNIVLHFLRDGTILTKLTIRKSEYFIPVVLLLKALKDSMTSDREICTAVLRGAHLDGDSFISDRIDLLLQQTQDLDLYSADQCRAYLGSRFRNLLDIENSPGNWSVSDIAAGEIFLHTYIFPHLNNWSSDRMSHADVECKNNAVGGLSSSEIGLEKFNLLIEMIRKLYNFVSGKCSIDNSDALNNHEILTGGHLYLMLLKERLEQYLVGIKGGLRRAYGLARSDATRAEIAEGSVKIIRKVLDQQPDIGKKLFYFLSTGNVVSPSGLALMQTAGFTVVAEKLNRYRYISHFRSVHRGQFFTTMKTTAVRKLLPESWGFLCPVHTPDGTPCGLLNHLSAQCAIVSHHPDIGNAFSSHLDSSGGDQAISFGDDVASSGLRLPSSVASLAPTSTNARGGNPLTSPLSQLIKRLVDWGIAPAGPRTFGIVPSHHLVPVMIDGRLIGHASASLLMNTIVPRLHRLKATALRIDATELKKRSVSYFQTAIKLSELATDPFAMYSATLEVYFVNPKQLMKGADTGLFLFTSAARMMRPVVHLETGLVELIGNMEQTYLDIAVRPEEVRLGVDTHCELWPTAMLSVVASLTPLSDFNQSPRNMYQCQMGKQTMGTPAHNIRHRTDNKLYRIQTPQAPISQTQAQSTFMMDEYPNGTNAVVAVISYTGYDMEDAMILNKSSVERGFAHGSIYKTKVVDLTEDAYTGFEFGNIHLSGERSGTKIVTSLGLDGLPEPGLKLTDGSPLWCCFNKESLESRIEKYKDSEAAVVDQVRIIGSSGDGKGELKKASITLRYNRNPVVGDKFSSRHGQKGVLSVAWPAEDMPFSETGIVPDVIINPHAFPSRMTIGMLIESMAGKAGAMHGHYQDCTPFSMHGDEENETAIDFFGQQLLASGYAYHGSEPLYSGVLGTILKADIFIGVVYYQRLRHLVKDKAQCRMLGPIDQVTRQPVKGRKRMGGVRFGEMERDSLIAHGSAFVMRDRLLICSDKHSAFVCCGSIIGVYNQPGKLRDSQQNIISDGNNYVNDESRVDFMGSKVERNTTMICNTCGRSDRWYIITIPYVFRYLVNELAAMGIKLEIA